MKNFGNFLVKQVTELRKELLKNFVCDDTDARPFIQQKIEYFSFVIAPMDYKQLVAHAKEKGIKIPCPSNY